MTLKTYTSVDAKQNFGRLLDEVQHEPVTITKHNRDIAVVFSQQIINKLTDFLSDYFKEQVRSGALTFVEAFEMQMTILRDGEEGERAYERGECQELTPQLIQEIKQSIPKV